MSVGSPVRIAARVGYRRKHVRPERATRALALFVWAGFFCYLWFSGEVYRYLGPRTLWVVPFGAVTLALACLAHLPLLLSEEPGERLSPRQIGALIAIVAPVVGVVAVPSPELGALAAGRKSTGAAGVAGSFIAPVPDARGELSFIDVHFAESSEEYAATLGITGGTKLELTGFVTHGPDLRPDQFELTRFYISCCAADALPYSVAVEPAPGARDYPDDTWLEVSGSLERQGDRWVLVASRLRETREPKDPYLS